MLWSFSRDNLIFSNSPETTFLCHYHTNAAAQFLWKLILTKTECINGGKKKYSFVFVLISLTSLVSTDMIQRKSSFRTRLVGLISTKTKQFFFWPPFMHSVNELTASYLHHFHDSYPISITFFGILIKIEYSRKIKIQLTFNIIFIFFWELILLDEESTISPSRLEYFVHEKCFHQMITVVQRANIATLRNNQNLVIYPMGTAVHPLNNTTIKMSPLK